MLSEAKTLPFILKYYNMFILLCEWFIFFFFFLRKEGGDQLRLVSLLSGVIDQSSRFCILDRG